VWSPVQVRQPLDETGQPFTAFVRPGTSDLAVWNQMVRGREYAAVVRVIEESTCVEVKT
jgi:hypothetical protein